LIIRAQIASRNFLSCLPFMGKKKEQPEEHPKVFLIHGNHQIEITGICTGPHINATGTHVHFDISIEDIQLSQQIIDYANNSLNCAWKHGVI
jgi:hypothetical protein